ncbi:MAG TPA: hypothetical protein DCX77_09315 [Acidimicrobiaceae bacterium]|jgi:hypothetical protein|nr:hypothetical protein [Acidimicrobiaceae bacterium]|tara:strand:+ start:3119 stop:3736 length:618 start_codon:yes stop_codon:yes gene_type:complete
MGLKHRTFLGPPTKLVDAAKAVMGAIDFDPFSTQDLNRMVGAARIIDRDQHDLDSVVAMDWELPGDKRALVGAPHGSMWTRRLANKTLREYRKGNVEQAVIWIANNETITKIPWAWDFPVCIPFSRLKPTYYDDELEMLRSVCPSSWSCVVYLPPIDPQGFHSKLSRFQNTFCTIGSIVFNEESGQRDWEKAYEIGMKKKYNYRD